MRGIDEKKSRTWGRSTKLHHSEVLHSLCRSRSIGCRLLFLILSRGRFSRSGSRLSILHWRRRARGAVRRAARAGARRRARHRPRAAARTRSGP